MSINWSWSKCIGECVDEQGYTHYIYPCNGLIVVLNEWNENDEHYYSMYDFRCDWEHEKNCVSDDIYMFASMKKVVVDYKKMREYYKKTDVTKLIAMFYCADSVELVHDYVKGPLKDIEELRKNR